MLLPLNVANELLQLSDLRIKHLLEELRGEFLGDSEFVGPLHRLVEITAKPTEVLLVLVIEGGHFMESLDFATGGGVVELCYGIANHCADSLVACCLTLEKGILFWSEPHFANDVSFVHCFLKIRYELRVSLPPVRQLWQVGF